VPLPLPPLPAVIVSHGGTPVTVQAQPGWEMTLTLPDPGAGPKDALLAESA
jgi:hypothetical protein